MSISKPNDWYSMTSQQQDYWKKQAREYEDLEYDLDRARQATEAANAKRLKDMHMYRDITTELQENLARIGGEASAHEAELDLCRQFLAEKGLAAEFDDWASYRRED